MKRILLAVCGLNPQVVTETLYALNEQGRLPNSVKIVTTRQGKLALNAHMFGPTGQYARFCTDFSIDGQSVAFSQSSVFTVADQRGREIDDIDGSEESELFLEACMNLTFELTCETSTSVYFSVAGGRKTMGSSLALAAQCYGRPQDRLYHVLVSPEFENADDFFYPPPISRLITLRDSNGQPYLKESRFARVSLVSIPLISLREKLPMHMLSGPESPASLMASSIKDPQGELVVDLPGHKIVWNERECDLMPTRLALYAFFALRKRNAACAKDRCGGCDQCFLSIQDICRYSREIASLHSQSSTARQMSEMSDTGIQSLNQENFNSYRTKTNRDLRNALGQQALKDIELSSRGSRPGVRYGLPLDRCRIRVVI